MTCPRCWGSRADPVVRTGCQLCRGEGFVPDEQLSEHFRLSELLASETAARKRLSNAPLAIVDKRRDKPGQSEVMNIIGEVRDRHCILIDDIIDSGGTLCNAAQALMDQGAASVAAYLTHGVLSGGAVERVEASALKELVITDSILPSAAARAATKIRILPIAPLIGEAIRRIADESSVSSLFD